MNLLFSVLWIVIAGAYILYRLGHDLRISDVILAVAVLVFAISTFVQGEVFWQPIWNLCLKLLALATVLTVSFWQYKKRE